MANHFLHYGFGSLKGLQSGRISLNCHGFGNPGYGGKMEQGISEVNRAAGVHVGRGCQTRPVAAVANRPLKLACSSSISRAGAAGAYVSPAAANYGLEPRVALVDSLRLAVLARPSERVI